MAEAYALSKAVEHGLRTLATIVDMRRQLNIRQWEETAASGMGHVWFADCETLFAHLFSPIYQTSRQHNNSSGTIAMIVTNQRAVISVGLARLRCCQIA